MAVDLIYDSDCPNVNKARETIAELVQARRESADGGGDLPVAQKRAGS